MDRMRVSTVLVAVTALVAAGVAAPAGRSAELAVSGRANVYPSVAASGRFVAVVWGATVKSGPADVYAAVSRDAGRTFETPTLVSDAASRANLAAEQPPRVALVPRAGQDPSIVVVWTSRGAAGTRLVAARSDDGGRSYGAPKPVPGGEARGNRGWQSVATDSRGRVVAVWLDHRELAAAGSGTGAAAPPAHEHTPRGPADSSDGVARAQLSKLFFGTLDGSASPRALTGGVCYCCKTAVAAGANGAIHAAWRHVYPGNIRDIAFAMSRDGGRTFAAPVRISEDNWAIDGCPENGPAVGVDASGRIHVVWPTLVAGAVPAAEPTLALFHATSRDGRQFTRRQQIPTEGMPQHVQITFAADDAPVAVWEEEQPGVRRIALGRGIVEGGGAVRFVRQVVSGASPAVTPAVAAAAGGLVVVWTNGPAGETVLRTAQLAY